MTAGSGPVEVRTPPGRVRRSHLVDPVGSWVTLRGLAGH